MSSYQDRQVKQAAAEFRRRKMFEQSGAASGTLISQTGAPIQMGTVAPAEKPFEKLTGEEVEALPADRYKAYYDWVAESEATDALRYLNALGKTKETEGNKWGALVSETVTFTIPYLRVLKAIQLTLNAPSIHSPEVQNDADFWTFPEYKAMTLAAREDLNKLVSVVLGQHGRGDYAGIGQ